MKAKINFGCPADTSRDFSIFARRGKMIPGGHMTSIQLKFNADFRYKFNAGFDF